MQLKRDPNISNLKILHNTLALFLTFLAFFAYPLNAAPKREVNILIVHSEDQFYSRFLELTSSFYKEMNASTDIISSFYQIELKNSNKDSKNLIEQNNKIKAMSEDMANGKYDAILAIGDAASEKVKSKIDLLKKNIPVFLMAVSEYNDFNLITNKNIYGNILSTNPLETAKLARRMFPFRRNLILLTDTSASGNFIKNKLKDFTADIDDLNLSVLVCGQVSDEEMIKRIKYSEDNTIILFYNWENSEHNPLDDYMKSPAILSDIFEKCKSPIFVLRKRNIQYGTMGGCIQEINNLSDDAALRLSKLLNNKELRSEKIKKIPLIPLLDWRMIEHYNVSPESIPQNSIILNQPANFWSINKMLIIKMIVFILSILSLLLLIAFIKSIKQKKKLEFALEDAKQAEAAKSNFLSTMSHEIRTPLNAVIGFTELLESKTLSDIEKSEYLSAIRSAGASLLMLINDILDLSKLEAGKFQLKVSKTDIKKSLEDIVNIFIQKAKDASLYLDLDFETDIPYLYIDNAHFRQIIVNLVGNAIKFTKEGGISINVKFNAIDDKKGTLFVEVVDTGIGINKDFMPDLFKPFTQQNNYISKLKKSEGTGLGLSISQKLAATMNGNITVKSENGEGSSFTVTLESVTYDKAPISSKEVNIPKTQTIHTDAINKKILIVDDQRLNLLLLQKIFSSMGITVSKAESAKAALEIINKNKIDIVISDLKMPIMDGIEMATAIRKMPEQKDIKIYILTADIYAENIDFSIINGVLTKPITMQKIKNILLNKENTGNIIINELNRE